jgi:phosphoglycerol transferase MdoB-like AlkP superfamily enzyme
MNTEAILSVLVGVALAAACGFRVFVPLLVVSIASYAGHVHLASGFEWIGTLPSLITFAVATVFEIAGYYIPWVDHVLDVIATPAAIVAGAVVMASSIIGMSPFLHWTLAIIAGSGAAGLIQAFTGVTRLTSTATTGGLGNPVVSTAEAGGSITLSVLAVLVPLAAAALVALVLFFAARVLYKKLLQRA